MWLNIILKLIASIFLLSSLVLYLVCTSTQYWQNVTYKKIADEKEARVKLGESHIESTHGAAYLRFLLDKRRISDYSGLWSACYTLVWPHRPYHIEQCGSFKGLEVTPWLRTVRAFMSLAIVAVMVAFGYLIATFIRYDLEPQFAGVMGIITGLFALVGLAIYTGMSGVPADNAERLSKFSWSFKVGWAAWIFNVLGSGICFLCQAQDERK